MKFESFGKKAVMAIATVGTLIGGCKKEMQKYKGTEVDAVKQTLDCKALINVDFRIDGKIVYQTSNMPNETTVIGIKMIHPSKTYRNMAKLNYDIDKLHDQIVSVLEIFMEKGMNNVGGEGLDYGAVNKDNLITKKLANSHYAFIKMEIKHGNDVNSFWIDDTEIREKMLELSHQGKPIEGIKLNSKREDSMVQNIKKILLSQNIKCMAVVAGAEHLEKERDPVLKQLIGDKNLINRLENAGVNVVVIEPALYGQINKQLQSLKSR